MKRNGLLLELTIISLMLMLSYAAVSKLISYQEFQSSLSQSPLLHSFSGLLTIAVPATELLLVCMLLTNRFRKAGLFGSLFLLSLFNFLPDHNHQFQLLYTLFLRRFTFIPFMERTYCFQHLFYCSDYPGALSEGKDAFKTYWPIRGKLKT